MVIKMPPRAERTKEDSCCYELEIHDLCKQASKMDKFIDDAEPLLEYVRLLLRAISARTYSSSGSAGVSPTIGTGTGNSNLYIGTDLVHPTGGTNSSNNGLDSGRCYLSKWLYNSVKQAVMAY